MVDKNGNEIKIGDTLKIPMSTYLGKYDKNFEEVKVVFEDGHTYIDTSKVYKDQPRVLLFKDHALKSEIIGNI